MTTILYGRPPAVFDPPTDAVQTSPLIPGSADLAETAPGSLDAATILAPPGVLERRHVLALALKALKPGGRLDVMAPKGKGGSRLMQELRDFGLEPVQTSKAHHKRCVAVRPQSLSGLDEAIAAGAPRPAAYYEAADPAEGFWSQPGIFAWDRVDPGTNLLIEKVLLDQGVDLPFKGAGADLGCGAGLLAGGVLDDGWPQVTSLRLIDIDRRAIQAARRNITDPRARFEWADVRTLEETGDLDFVVTNPPFHDGGAESKGLGVAFIRKAAGLLRPGGTLFLVANRHLPYEAELEAVFMRVHLVTDEGGYKIFKAVK